MKVLNRLLGAAHVLESTGEVQGGNLGALLVELAASIRGDVAELTRGEVAAPGEVAGDDELIDGDGEWPPVIATMRR